MKTALFDFDGTISKGDSVVSFLLYCYKKKVISFLFLVKVCLAFAIKKLFPFSTFDPKAMAHIFLKGWKKNDMDALCKDYISSCIIGSVFPEAISELQNLRNAGVTVVVVSASASAYMQFVPDFLPVDQVICTECVLDDDLKYTGELEGNCKGAEKCSRIKEILKGCSIVLAYGDSYSDRFMLDLADEAVMVNPSRKLVKYFASSGKRCKTVHWSVKK